MTKSGREAQAWETGVQWTPLHCLPYWDPVKHVVLGFMHSGVLQHHLCVLWYIGLPEEVKKITVKLEKDEQWLQANSHELAEELEGLQKEAEEANEQADVEAHTMWSSPTLSTRSNVTPTQEDPQPNPYAFTPVVAILIHEYPGIP